MSEVRGQGSDRVGLELTEVEAEHLWMALRAWEMLRRAELREAKEFCEDDDPVIGDLHEWIRIARNLKRRVMRRRARFGAQPG